MNTPNPGAPAPSRKTHAVNFFTGGSVNGAMFSVNPDIPIDDAIGEASCLLASAIGTMKEICEQCDVHPFWAALFLIESAKAVVDATASNLMKQETIHE